MRTYKNLFTITQYSPIIEEYLIGYTRIYIYQKLELDDEIFFSRRINVLFKLVIYSNYLLFWFKDIDEMYEELNMYLELNDELSLKIIVIID